MKGVSGEWRQLNEAPCLSGEVSGNTWVATPPAPDVTVAPPPPSAPPPAPAPPPPPPRAWARGRDRKSCLRSLTPPAARADNPADP